MESDPGPAIDLEHLGTHTQGDRDLERELLSMFLPSAQGYIDAMSAAAGSVWWTAAHSLKGVALGVGARNWPIWPHRPNPSGTAAAAAATITS